jgi:hypothetical protein
MFAGADHLAKARELKAASKFALLDHIPRNVLERKIGSRQI